MQFKILLLEDSESDIDVFLSTVERMNDEIGEERYCVKVAGQIDEAKATLLSESFHGCVVDIKLGEEDGNDFIESVVEAYRMPVVVYSATPDVDYNVKCFEKASYNPTDVIKELESELETGMFQVLGGKGAIEKNLNSVFWNVLYPQMDIWKDYKNKGMNTEEVLLRYTLAHLLELLDENGPDYCTEEMYICGEMINPLRTGSIVKCKNSQCDYVLLSPPCDLAERENGEIDTDTLLLCEIEPIDWSNIKNQSILNVVKNNKGAHYHWLPDNKLYKGGRLNFRKLVTCTLDEFQNDYEYKKVKIQEYFVKSILQRFSAYYARQGQPDFNFELEADQRKKK